MRKRGGDIYGEVISHSFIYPINNNNQDILAYVIFQYYQSKLKQANEKLK